MVATRSEIGRGYVQGARVSETFSGIFIIWKKRYEGPKVGGVL